MWDKILAFGKDIVALTNDMRKTRADIADLQAEVERLARLMDRVIFEFQRDRENAAHERDKLLLRLELALVKNQLKLPPADAASEKREIE